MRTLSATKRQLVDLEGSQVVSRQTYQRVLCERRVMALALIGCLFGVVLYLIAVATSDWAYVRVTYDNKTTEVRLGVWGERRTDSNHEGKKVSSVWIPHFPLPEDRPRLADRDLPHYYRSQAIFCVFALLLMIASIVVGICSLKHHRYMYKRLVSVLMFIAAMLVLVTIQVLIHSIEEWASFSVTHSIDYDDHTTYGFSTIFAWIVFSLYVAGAVIFLIGGRKNKGLHAATFELEVQDRPMNLSKLNS